MVQVARMEHLSDKATQEFTRIYEASFTPEERFDVDQLLAAVASGQLMCHLALEGDSVVGLALFLDLGETGVWFVAYLAVAPEMRGRGVGTQLLQQIGMTVGSAGAKGIIGEVEDPEDAEGEERSMRLRRIDLYRRHGTSLVDCAPRFRVPRTDAEGTLPYRLMWVPLPGGPPRLEGPLLRSTVQAILTKWNGLPNSDPLVAAVLADLRC